MSRIQAKEINVGFAEIPSNAHLSHNKQIVLTPVT